MYTNVAITSTKKQNSFHPRKFPVLWQPLVCFCLHVSLSCDAEVEPCSLSSGPVFHSARMSTSLPLFVLGIVCHVGYAYKLFFQLGVDRHVGLLLYELANIGAHIFSFHLGKHLRMVLPGFVVIICLTL